MAELEPEVATATATKAKARRTPAKARQAESDALEKLSAAGSDDDGTEKASEGTGEAMTAAGGDTLPPESGAPRAEDEPAVVVETEDKIDLSEAAHLTAIERMEAQASEYDVDQRSLVPDVRDFLLDQIKSRPKPWAATSNGEQHDVAAACEHAAVELVRKVVEAIRADPKSDPIRCLLVGFADKGDDIKVELRVKALSAEETVAAVIGLHKAKSKHVLLTVASVDDYRQDNREAALDDDEPPLDFEASVAGRALDDETFGATLGGDDIEVPEEPEIARTGTQMLVDNHGLCDVQVNLETGMIEGRMAGDDTFSIDVREATPAELAAERDRIADFTDDDQASGGGGEEAD